MSDSVIEVSDADFEKEIIQSDIPAMVDLWAAWCQPCLRIGPVVKELAGEYAGRLKVAKLDVDGNPNIPSSYGVRSIPTILFFKGGELVDRSIGVVPKSEIEKLIQNML